MTRQDRGSISLAAPDANESGRFSTFAGKRAFNSRKGLLHGLGARQQLPAGLRQRISRRASCKKRRPGTRLARLDAAGHGWMFDGQSPRRSSQLYRTRTFKEVTEIVPVHNRKTVG